MNLSFKTKYSFGVGALGKDLVYAIVSSYLMIYLTDLVGISPLFVGNLFLVARVWDAFNDPMMGMIVDNTRSKYGKFRPWILLGTLVNAVVLIFLFKKPNLTGTSLYAYFSVMYILWGMTYTLMDIPYWSMLPSLSKTKEERDQMSVIPRIFASSAGLIIGAFGLAMVNKLGSGDQTIGYGKLAIIISVIFVISSIITVVNVKDSSCNMASSGQSAEKTTLKQAFKVIKENDQLLVYIGVVLSYNLVAQLAGGMAIYYFKYVTGNENMYSVFTAFASLAEISALILFPIISKKMSKRNVFRMACYLPAVGLIMLLLVGIFMPTNATLIATSGIIMKMGTGFILGATTVMLADVIDYNEVKFGTRNESIIASFQTLLVKGASAVSAWLIGVGLTIVGYKANVVQTAGTIFGMRVLMIGIPSVISIIAFIIYKKGYKIEGQFQDEIINKLEEKRNAEIV